MVVALSFAQIRPLLFALLVPLGMAWATTAFAQEGSVDPLGNNAPPGLAGEADEAPFSFKNGPKNKLNLGAIPGLDLGGAGDDSEVTFEAEWKLEAGTRTGRLIVKASIPENWHIYSLTQPAGGPQISKLEFAKGSPVQLAAPFVANPPPHVIPPGGENAFKVNSEEHEGEVQWSATISFAGKEDPKTIPVVINYSGQRCKNGGSCIPFDTKITAKFAGEFTRKDPLGTYTPKKSEAEVVWKGELSANRVRPGDKLSLVLTAKPTAGYHLYEYQVQDASIAGAGKPTLIVLNLPAGWKYRVPTASVAPTGSKEQGTSGIKDVQHHAEEVTWTTELIVPADARPGKLPISGFLGFQTCNDANCLAPTAAQFQATVEVAESGSAAEAALLEFEGLKEGYKAVVSYAKSAPAPFGVFHLETLLTQLGLGFIGGILLNFMPCVLPVLGLKLLAIAQQAGQSRTKVLLQNIWYTAGLMVVFLTLATLAAFLNFGWGQHFQSLWFRIGMLLLTFSMALSFLGTWEIPIPGFATSDKAGELQSAEGAMGAFFKGIFTTILGVSCSGPFLGAVFGYTLSQEWYVTYAIFVAVGLGMASPFFAVGLVPGVRKIIPKPGNWMDTFKNLMGFGLLGVVVFLFSTLDSKLFTPTLSLVVAVWFACWWIGQVHAYEDWKKVMVPWVGGTAVASLVGFLAFTYLVPQGELYHWEKFSEERLAQLQREGKTVMLDFTADWCLNCHVNFRNAINTSATKQLIDKNNVVAMKADWTNKDDQVVSDKLKSLNSNSIPVLVFYPAGKPNEAVILRDIVTQQQVLDELEKAGPSRSEKASAATTAGKPVPPKSS